MTNPWNLTPRQIVVMEAVIRLGISKEVARELRIEVKAVENLRVSISKKMNAPMLVAAVMWDRFARDTSGVKTD